MTRRAALYVQFLRKIHFGNTYWDFFAFAFQSMSIEVEFFNVLFGIIGLDVVCC